jgi:hypothetical protein
VHSRIILLSCITFIFSQKGFSQRTHWGRIYDEKSHLVLESVSVENISSDRSNSSDQGGNFKISAKPGDTLVFSSIAYAPDTLIININDEAMLNAIYLRPRAKFLAAVTVLDDQYSRDSLERKNYYRKFTDSTGFAKMINDSSVASGGFGITLSPISYFSKSQKNARKFKKRLAEDERQAYVDSRFSRGYVARITALKGDSLQTFLIRYRPGYDFCRKSNREDMLRYINSQLMDYKKGIKRKKYLS